MFRNSVKIFMIYIFFILIVQSKAKKVLLKDVTVLTLYHGKMTTGRRSAPMHQLDCVSGGSAPCTAFTPRVVQCTNKGSDGYDIQWDCKTDMDNAFRFGHVEVSCEGYDYPDDPYVLYGSCGLKYSLDYTKEGLNKKDYHNYGSEQNGYHNSHYSYGKGQSKSSSTIADIIVYIAGGLMIYAFYKTCISSNRSQRQDAYSTTNDDHPSSDGRGGGYGWFGGGGGSGTNPSAPRYNEYSDDASCRNRNSSSNATGGAGGFWTGAAAGGLMGYMFGNRQNWWGGGRGAYQRTPGYGGGWFSSPGYSGGGFSGSYSSPSSSGTRSASGFGGTSRR